MKINNIILGAVMTEKATNLTKKGIYTFEVNPQANKNQITKALETLYKIKIEKVRIARHFGKRRKVGRRMVVRKLPDKRIAYVKVKEGKIDLFPQA
ncbi:MAG: 50S ribosomal protein L23 [Microgenomates group bacterium]|nr:50S ribosomal protein L23 [Microgenomates group bacterium]